jgi:serine protease inhibitor
MFNKIQILIFIIIIYLLTSCSTTTSPLDVKKESTLPRALTSTEKSLIEADKNFGLKLFQSINESTTSDNIFISPLSVSFALGMTLNGANGQTYEDMKSTLELNGLTEQEINEAYKSLIDLLLNLDEEVIMEIANSIWPREGYPILPSFMEINQKYFYSEAKPLDFNRTDAVDIINAWISENTRGRIKDMLDYIDPYAVMYLINAIYFKGTWTYQFDEESTQIDNFYTTPDNPNECQLMKISGTWLYSHNDFVEMVDLPYGDSLYSMTVLLPAANQTINEFIMQMTPEKLEQYFQNLNYKFGTITMPKLKLDYIQLLNDVLINLGMEIAFDPDAADFSRINGYGGLYINRVIHQSFIQIDEEGTEAAAATIVEICLTSALPGNTGFHMYVNRPYIFIIRERVKNTILFIGKITKPEWSK